MWCYVDGEFQEGESARVPITDRSFLYGDGCFEGIAIREGKVLHLDEHVARLEASARMLQIELPVSTRDLRELVLRTASINGMHEVELGYLRPLLSRGSGYVGLRHTSRLAGAHLYIIPQLEAELTGPGPQVSTAALTRVSPGVPASLDPRIKSNNYLPHVLALLEAQRKGAEVAIHCDGDGFILEAHAMNILCVRGNQVLSPPESAALAGITRANVIAVATACGYETEQRPITAYDLINADEVFMTSSLDAIAALESIDGVKLREPVPGPATARLHAEYLSRAMKDAVPVPAPTPDSQLQKEI